MRPTIQGKFLFSGARKLYVKGVTYGTFRPRAGDPAFGGLQMIEQDFSRIVDNGMNAIRTYTVPPVWLLDAAQRHGMYVMVGLPWEQHIAFLDQNRRPVSIEQRVRAAVRSCEKHPAILSYAIGNEIPAPVVRWYGRKRVENFLQRLFHAVKSEDADALVTYVNYPSTEYLLLPFLDFVCFNVFLESQPALERYLARLQNIADDRPLLLTELGLDSRRNGESSQARTLDWQIRTAFASGCAGTFVFAWTDEWYRGGYDITDWDFGLTTRNRQPKEALATVRKSFNDIPLAMNGSSPRVSVVVCVRNAEATIGETLAGLQQVAYENFEVIVIDDGSTDSTFRVASQFPFRVVQTENRGLAAARNTGMELSTGDIIAYIDGDAYPDEQWLTHLALTFSRGDYEAVGGPNIPPLNDGMIARCVAVAPGGPIHVLVSDSEAEHIPGCNMAFLKSSLRAIGGFDPQFRTAGDDVDVCWRLIQRGWKIGFSPGAVVWHHRRNSLVEYWNQQVGYGKAEAMLEKKWPENYNRLGHISWRGRLYGSGHTRGLPLGRWRIYHGMWGTGLFQPMYTQPTGRLLSLPLTPEWNYIVAGFAGLSLLSAFWKPLFVAFPLLIASVAVQISQSVYAAAMARLPHTETPRTVSSPMFALIAFLHLLQPLARLVGRVRYGLTPWRRRSTSSYVFPRSRTFVHWQESWQSPESILRTLTSELRAGGLAIIPGGEYDRWDLEVRVGSTGAVRLRALVEEHGGGKQLIRFFCWPVCSLNRCIISASTVVLAIVALLDGAWVASALIGGVGTWLTLQGLLDCAAAASAVECHFKKKT